MLTGWVHLEDLQKRWLNSKYSRASINHPMQPHATLSRRLSPVLQGTCNGSCLASHAARTPRRGFPSQDSRSSDDPIASVGKSRLDPGIHPVAERI
jgi:hypothetical protein